MSRPVLILVLACLLPAAAGAYEPGEQTAAASQFTFAWPLGEHALKPRGGTSRGTQVVLDTAEGDAWKRLREAGHQRLRA